MKIKKTNYTWEFLDMNKTEKNVIKMMIDSGVFGSMVSHVDIYEKYKEVYDVKIRK